MTKERGVLPPVSPPHNQRSSRVALSLNILCILKFGMQRKMKIAHVAEKDLTGVHLAILVAGTHEDLWDNLVPSRLEEHALALLVAEDWHRDVLQDGRKNPTLAQSSPPGTRIKMSATKRERLRLTHPATVPNSPISWSSLPGRQMGMMLSAKVTLLSVRTRARSFSYVKKLYFGWTTFFAAFNSR